MKMKGPKENFRVVVEPRSLGDFGAIRCSPSLIYGHDAMARERMERYMQDRCDEIAKDIKRHADNVRSVEVEFDQEDICSFCGAKWTEASATYNGGCCAEDQENDPEDVQAVRA